MLLDKQLHQHFPGKTRQEINAIAGGKSPEGKEWKQAELLAQLREEHILQHNKHQGFSLGERARLI